MSHTDTHLGSPTREKISEHLDFTRRNGRYKPSKQRRLQNSLLAAVGFLELANAGDFAANVWNMIPVPRYAIAFMAIGGTLALTMSLLAVRDAQLSWRNIRFLRDERQYLGKERDRHVQGAPVLRVLNAWLDVNFREFGTEVVDRFGMDITMGIGALLVGVGTLMAIGGADPVVYRTSNLLSGYLGNSPAMLFGTVNTVWSMYVWIRGHRHEHAGAKEFDGSAVARLLKARVHTVKMHATLNGLGGLIAGVASIITATRWWGYVILAPCIVSSIYCNYVWRRRIGYDRPGFQHMSRGDKASLVEELEFVSCVGQVLEDVPEDPLGKLVSDPESVDCVLEFLVKNDLFEDFCGQLLQDEGFSGANLDSSKPLTIDSLDLVTANESCVTLLAVARKCIHQLGLIRFEYRKRYLLETLGCHLSILERERTFEKSPRIAP